jgi:hypothetical protein
MGAVIEDVSNTPEAVEMGHAGFCAETLLKWGEVDE